MKKTTIIILIMFTFLSFNGCVDKQEVQKVEALIDAIGTVSLDSEDCIDEAMNAYSALSEKEQGKVGNYDTLINANEAYNALLSQELERQGKINELIEVITRSADKYDFETVFDLYPELIAMNPAPETVEKVNELVELIPKICFAGTFFVQPEYVTQVDFDKYDASLMSADRLIRSFDARPAVIYYYSTETKAQTACKQYQDYLDGLDDLQYMGIEGGGYIYADVKGNSIEIGYGGNIFSLIFDRAFLDNSKIDWDVFTGKTTLRETEKILKN